MNPQPSSRFVWAVALPALVVVLALSWGVDGLADQNPSPPLQLVKQFTSFSAFPASASWEKSAPHVKSITIPSTADGSLQPALFFNSGTEHKKPLLVVLHSWSDNYRQKFSIPYAVFAQHNDWVFIHPDYRGAFNNSRATGSELAVQDIRDAVGYALKSARVDPSRIYLAGFSGGAMMSLIMAGRYPELWTAVAAWVPVFNLTQWYPYVRRFPNRHYARNIANSCGGPPSPGSEAALECDRRSPSAYLKNARGKDLRIYIGHGIQDDFAPPGHSLKAFNELADPLDRIADADIQYIDSQSKLPPRLRGSYTDPLYQQAGKSLLYRKISGNTTVSLFAGGHDVLYNAGLHWLSQQSKP